MGDSSARHVTGVGPRHAFTFNGTGGSGITTDQVVGVGIVVASTANLGLWDVTHNLGKTGYCVQFFPEHSGEAVLYVTHRGTTCCKVEAEDNGGTNINPDFVHGIIYD